MTENYESEEKKSTFMPIVISLGVTILFLGLVIFLPLAGAGLTIFAVAVLKVYKDGVEDKFAGLKETIREKFPLETLSKEKTGVWLFLMSEILIFGSLIVAYIYVRINSASYFVWPVSAQIQNPILGMTLSFILLSSGLAMTLSVHSIRQGKVRGLKIGLITAFSLGLLFDLIHFGYEWPNLFSAGFTFSSNLSGSSYFVLTGLHGVHVAAGLVAIGYLITKSYQGGFTSSKYTAVEGIGLYWAFVDIVWIFLFPLLYLI